MVGEPVDGLRAAIDESTRFYRATDVPAHRRLEAIVLGTGWGGNGYTTADQAAELVHLLALAPGARLLDVGAGRGWPGNFLATISGCDVVLVDLPQNTVHQGVERAGNAGSGSVTGVVGSATALPFRAESFDAVVHTDVLC